MHFLSKISGELEILCHRNHRMQEGICVSASFSREERRSSDCPLRMMPRSMSFSLLFFIRNISELWIWVTFSSLTQNTSMRREHTILKTKLRYHGLSKCLMLHFNTQWFQHIHRSNTSWSSALAAGELWILWRKRCRTMCQQIAATLQKHAWLMAKHKSLGPYKDNSPGPPFNMASVQVTESARGHTRVVRIMQWLLS